MVKRQTLTLITGADKGIGFETAMALGKRGQHLLVGARNQARGEQAINKLHTAGVSAEWGHLRCDPSRHHCDGRETN